ncbi:MAG TPA: aminodeoxychorismate/anthranilate synthase component II, partial [Pseudodesulfovibrio sp.]|nr:aminodeoxychorismate/anthranilate synthase component II [Pseudodesulfovibrio sp.]
MFLLIDNFDSFTFNLVQAFQQLGADPVVIRNDREKVLKLAESGELERVCLSPGPSTPQNAGFCLEFLARLPKEIPVLGVCLGHQSIGEAFGGRTIRAERLMHGKTSSITHDGIGVFTGLPNPFEAMRYHSLVVAEDDLPSCLMVTARSDRGELMGLRHKEFAVEGVQFHPESIMTPDG